MNEDLRVLRKVFLQAMEIISQDRGTAEYREPVWANLAEIAQRVDSAYVDPPGWIDFVRCLRDNCASSVSLAQFSRATRNIWNRDLQRFYKDLLKLEVIANG